MSRQTFGRRVNQWLAEPRGETFKHGKWRFWYPALVGLTALNATMTAIIFGSGGMQKYIGAVVMLAGAVLCWIAVGLLHYSDGEDRILALGVAILDSLSLLFVAAHFSFLLWAQGHLYILRAAEETYRTDMATYNTQWKPVAESNNDIARTVERIAEIEKQTERLRNDTAYWSRRNGAKTAPKSGLKFEAEVKPLDVPPPPKAPSESSAVYLAGWDSWIRLAGFGELGLSVITLIFVRSRATYMNSSRRVVEDFPEELDAEERPAPPRPRLEKPATHVSSKITTTQRAKINDTEGLKILRETLKLIAFHRPPMHFKVDMKSDCVWIRSMTSDHGVQRTESAAKAKLDILTDAVNMPREAFQERLERFLIQNGFDLEGGGV